MNLIQRYAHNAMHQKLSTMPTTSILVALTEKKVYLSAYHTMDSNFDNAFVLCNFIAVK